MRDLVVLDPDGIGTADDCPDQASQQAEGVPRHRRRRARQVAGQASVLAGPALGC
jgi:hypothetical protein